ASITGVGNVKACIKMTLASSLSAKGKTKRSALFAGSEKSVGNKILLAITFVFRKLAQQQQKQDDQS
ncbi:MAG: hypothetical protein AAFN10_06455, partial [Bacteroidota bacterium]